MSHNGELPPLSCMKEIKSKIYPTPPVYKFDYYCELHEISIQTLLQSFIQNFRPDYTIIHEAFSLKYLHSFKSFGIIGKIDMYYVKYKNSKKNEQPESRLSSMNIHYDTSSILRPSNRQRYKSQDIKQISDSGVSTEFGKYKFSNQNKILPVTQSLNDTSQYKMKGTSERPKAVSIGVIKSVREEPE